MLGRERVRLRNYPGGSEAVFVYVQGPLQAPNRVAPTASAGVLLHPRLRLLLPVRHPHLAVHRRRGGEMRLRLLALARAPVELAEAEVAVGDEGAHAARLGKSQ